MRSRSVNCSVLTQINPSMVKECLGNVRNATRVITDSNTALTSLTTHSYLWLFVVICGMANAHLMIAAWHL